MKPQRANTRIVIVVFELCICSRTFLCDNQKTTVGNVYPNLADSDDRQSGQLPLVMTFLLGLLGSVVDDISILLHLV